MAKFLGIDFGDKKLGLAVSDDDGRLAFPVMILKNEGKTTGEIGKICRELGVTAIVLGESLNLKGEPNKIMPKAIVFKEKLENEIRLAVFWEKEFMTSTAALHFGQYLKGVRPDTARKTKRGKEKIDDSAAAFILQRYLDRRSRQQEGQSI